MADSSPDTLRRAASNLDPFDLVEIDLVVPAIIELRGACAGVVRHRSGLFEAAAAVLQIGCDPGRPERVVADLRGDASRSGAPANHTISVRLRHRRARRSRHRPSRFEADDSAQITIERIRKVMHVFRGKSSHRTTGAPARKLWHALHEVDKYLIGQSGWLVNYAKRRRASLRVGTSITEGTANFLVNRRMNKSQQMRWSRRGADLLLQVRCAVYNGMFGAGLGRVFNPISSPCPQLAKAA